MHQRSAFTLVELLVVIGIIALLISILLPALNSARQRGKNTVCLSNLRQIGMGVAMYASDHDGRFPLAAHSASPTGWLDTLVPFGIDVDVRLCPDDKRLDRTPSPTTSYLTNDYMQPLTAWIDFNPITGTTLPGGRTRPFLKLVDIRKPTLTAFVVESDLPGDHVHMVGVTTAAGLRSSVAVERHGNEPAGWSNFLFVDGHVEAEPWKVLRADFGADHPLLDPRNSQ